MIELIYLMWAHFIGDFILQSQQTAINKAKSLKVLTYHVGCYISPFILTTLFVPISYNWLLFNAIAHFITDYIFSRLKNLVYNHGNMWLFFVMVGLDQTIHITCLIWSYMIGIF